MITCGFYSNSFSFSKEGGGGVKTRLSVTYPFFNPRISPFVIDFCLEDENSGIIVDL